MMILLHVFVLYLGLCASAHVKATPPKFDSTYIVNGVLRLPYAEINEPFTAYFDSKNNRSRIDYYGGMSYRRLALV